MSKLPMAFTASAAASSANAFNRISVALPNKELKFRRADEATKTFDPLRVAIVGDQYRSLAASKSRTTTEIEMRTCKSQLATSRAGFIRQSGAFKHADPGVSKGTSTFATGCSGVDPLINVSQTMPGRHRDHGVRELRISTTRAFPIARLWNSAAMSRMRSQ